MKKIFSIIILIVFAVTSLKSPVYAVGESSLFLLPKPGVRIGLSPEFKPAQLAGVTIHPDNALKFDFLINQGDTSLTESQKREEYKKLIKYFLASLTIPDQDQWVNLSPYEKDRIIKSNFGQTEMGRDLLAQDYMLKQITSSLIYPEEALGKKFWDKIYERAWKQFGTTNVPVNTFNKVWIMPDEAVVYESGNTAYVLRNHLKVMLEEDYLSLDKHSGIETHKPANSTSHAIAAQIVKEIILPELEKEVNEGQNFANLRQIYSGMVLAAWYKKELKESLLGKVYANQDKVNGVNQKDPKTNQAIYQQYLQAFKKGVFNYIKEDIDKYSKESIPRKYFSGGLTPFVGAVKDPAEIAERTVNYYTDLNRIPSKIKGDTDFALIVANTDIVSTGLNPAGIGPAEGRLTGKPIDLNGDSGVGLPAINDALYQNNRTIVVSPAAGVVLNVHGTEANHIEITGPNQGKKSITFRGLPSSPDKHRVIFEAGMEEISDGKIFSSSIGVKMFFENGQLYMINPTKSELTFVFFSDSNFNVYPHETGTIRKNHYDGPQIFFRVKSSDEQGNPIVDIFSLNKNETNFGTEIEKIMNRFKFNITSASDVESKEGIFTIKNNGTKPLEIQVASTPEGLSFIKPYELAADFKADLPKKGSKLEIWIQETRKPDYGYHVEAEELPIFRLELFPHPDDDRYTLEFDSLKHGKHLIRFGTSSLGEGNEGVNLNFLPAPVHIEIKNGKVVITSSSEVLTFKDVSQGDTIFVKPLKPTNDVPVSKEMVQGSQKVIDQIDQLRESNSVRALVSNNDPVLMRIQGMARHLSNPSASDPAMDSKRLQSEGSKTKGGIDLNSANLNLQIKRDGKGVPLPLDQQDMLKLMQIPGFVPVIFEIKAATALPIFSELQEHLKTSARTLLASAQ